MNSRLEPSHIYFGNSFRRWRKRWTASKDDFIGNDNLFWIKIENALVICECLKIRNGKYWKWPKAHSWVCALRWITTTLDGCVNVVCWAHNCDMPGLIERVVVYCRLRITKLKQKKQTNHKLIQDHWDCRFAIYIPHMPPGYKYRKFMKHIANWLALKSFLGFASCISLVKEFCDVIERFTHLHSIRTTKNKRFWFSDSTLSVFTIG